MSWLHTPRPGSHRSSEGTEFSIFLSAFSTGTSRRTLASHRRFSRRFRQQRLLECIEASASYKRPDFRIAADCGRLRFASRPLGITKACRFPSPQSKPHVQTRSQSQSANDPVLISMGSWKRPSFCRTLNRCRLRPASSWMTIFGGPRDLELFIRPSKPRASNPKHRRTATCRLRSFLRSVFFTKLKPRQKLWGIVYCSSRFHVTAEC